MRNQSGFAHTDFKLLRRAWNLVGPHIRGICHDISPEKNRLSSVSGLPHCDSCGHPGANIFTETRVFAQAYGRRNRNRGASPYPVPERTEALQMYTMPQALKFKAQSNRR